MASSKAKTVEQYLDELEPAKREVIARVRQMVTDNIPQGFVETMNWGMICYEIPLSTYKNTYNKKPLMNIAIAAQKNYNSLYLMGIYMEDDLHEILTDGFDRAGLKMNMGKSCIRFKRIQDLPLETIGELIASVTLERYIQYYERYRVH